MTDEALKSVTGGKVGRVLVVDDEEMNRVLFREILEAEGHSVVVAADGAEALERALTEKPDVILLDVMMPKMDGFEVCRRLRQDASTAHVPVLMVTGLESQSKRIKGIESGANDFLTKPVDALEIRLRVRNAVYQQSLYKELQNRYQELKAMAELRENLTSIIEADTEILSSMLPQSAQPPEGGDHGTH